MKFSIPVFLRKKIKEVIAEEVIEPAGAFDDEGRNR